MTPEQVEMLIKALNLYEYSISQREYSKEEQNEFFKMRDKLTDLLEVEVRW